MGYGLAVGPRQRVIVTNGGGKLAVTEFRSDGHLRRSFGQGGTAHAAYPGGYAVATSVALDSRGRIVAAGYDQFHGHRGGRRAAFAVARFGRGGKLDDSFSHNGKAETSIGKFNFAKGEGIDSRGRIDVAGAVARSAGGDVGLVRYRPNGRLDRSFGGDGTVLSSGITPRAGTVDRRDRILVAGNASRGFGVARFVGYRHG